MVANSTAERQRSGGAKAADDAVRVALRRSYRYRLYPTKAQEQALTTQLELCRRVYNKALWWRQGAWERERRRVTLNEQRRALAPLRDADEGYAAISGGVLEEAVTRVDRAFKAFFRRVRRGGAPGYPRPKSPGTYRSLTVPRSRDFRLRWDGKSRYGRLSFKGFSGMRIRMHRGIPEGAKVRRLTIKCERSGLWYAALDWDVEGYHPDPHENADRTIGLHLGLVSYVSTDAGEVFEGPKDPEGEARRREQDRRRLARKQRGSRRHEKARRRAAKREGSARARRRDHRHNLSRELVRRYGRICVGTYGVGSLLRQNASRDLNRRINEAGWSELLFMLRYKAESAGGVLEEVDPNGIVQDCSRCGFVVDKDLSVRVHACPRCGLKVPRGVNAARNAVKRAASARRGGERVAAPEEARTPD